MFQIEKEIEDEKKNKKRIAGIGRLGGDEFGIAFTCKNEDFIIQIDSLIQERTQYFNKKYHLPYYVSLSYGISVFDYNSPFDLNHTIRLADTLMYERKKEKHIQRGKKDKEELF